MIKLIASDMDGTLLGKDRMISKENLEAIKRAQENQIHFAISTGRSFDDVKPFLEKYNLKCECVVLNGGEYRDIEGNIIESVYIDKEKAKEILNIMSLYDLSIEIYTNDGYYTTNTREETLNGMIKRTKTFNPEIKDSNTIYEMAIANPHFVNMKYIDDLNGFLESNVKIGKFVSFAESVEEINILKDNMNKINDLAVSSTFTTNIEINHKDATKGKILAKAANKLGLKKEEVAVLGDSYNDYSMFMEFPNSFAMENAIPEIKEAAKYITCSNSEHGVAKAIHKILDYKL